MHTSPDNDLQTIVASVKELFDKMALQQNAPSLENRSISLVSQAQDVESKPISPVTQSTTVESKSNPLVVPPIMEQWKQISPVVQVKTVGRVVVPPIMEQWICLRQTQWENNWHLQQVARDERGLEVNNVLLSGLNMAVKRKHWCVWRWLLAAIKPTKFQDSVSQIFYLAVSHGKVSVFSQLRDSDARLLWYSMLHSDNNLALKLACQYSQLKSLKFLTRFGSSFRLTIEDVRSNDNFAFRLACRSRNPNRIKILKYLKLLGLTVNDARAGDNFALRTAVQHVDLKLLRFLKGMGLDASDVKAHDNTILQWCVTNGKLGVMRMFKDEWGLSVDDIRSVNGNMILWNAISYFNLDILKLLREWGLTANDVRECRYFISPYTTSKEIRDYLLDWLESEQEQKQKQQ